MSSCMTSGNDTVANSRMHKVGLKPNRKNTCVMAEWRSKYMESEQQCACMISGDHNFDGPGWKGAMKPNKDNTCHDDESAHQCTCNVNTNVHKHKFYAKLKDSQKHDAMKPNGDNTCHDIDMYQMHMT